MCVPVSPRHFLSPVVVAFLVGILAFPASAQTGSDPNTSPSTSTAGAQAQSDSTGGRTSSNPVAPKTDVDTATPSTQTNSAAAKAESEPRGSQPQPNPGPKKTGSAILININKAKQRMTVFVDGIEKYHWPVSTGRAGYSTPSGSYTATSMNEIWYSKEWDNSPMPHSIFFIRDGHAIHGSYEVKNLGKPASHGCVRISPENATTLYALVKQNGLENTQVVLTGVTPGGEFKSARAPARAFHHLALPVITIITTDLKVTTDGRRPTHGGEGWALADFFKRPRSLNFVTTLRIFRIGTAKDRPMSALPPKADIGTQSWDVCLVPKADIAAVAR